MTTIALCAVYAPLMYADLVLQRQEAAKNSSLRIVCGLQSQDYLVCIAQARQTSTTCMHVQFACATLSIYHVQYL